MANQQDEMNRGVEGGRPNPASNLTREDRVRGGERSARMQMRDQRGKFAGRIGSQAPDRQQDQGQAPEQSGGRTSGR